MEGAAVARGLKVKVMPLAQLFLIARKSPFRRLFHVLGVWETDGNL